MKFSNFSKATGAAILACSLAVFPASAQESSPGGNTTSPDSTTTQTQATDDTTADRDFDWGWLGLIGLAGLAGLARKREEPVRYRDPGTVGTTRE